MSEQVAFRPGGVVRWFRGTSGVVMEGQLIERLVGAGYPTPMWRVMAVRTIPPDRAWPASEVGVVWHVTEAEMRFEAVRPLRTLEEAGLEPPVFDEAGNLVAGGYLSGGRP